MKILVFFQFYLPYLLPRTDDWDPAKYLQLQMGDNLALVHPRKPEDPLFPEKIDQELSALTFTIPPPDVSVAGLPTEVPIKDYCYDRVEILVYGEIGSVDEIQKEETRLKYLAAASQACNQFLQHCRVVGRDPDITGLEWHFNFTDRSFYFQNPYTMIWCREENGQIVERLRDAQGELLEGASAGSILGPKREPVSLTAVIENLKKGWQPRLPISLLVNAKALIVTDNLREGIINLASACETASREYVRRKGKENDPQATALADRGGGSFAEKRYHRLTMYIDGRSLKTDDPGKMPWKVVK